MNKPSLFLLSALATVMTMTPQTALAEYGCAYDYERVFKKMTGTHLPNAQYCSYDCDPGEAAVTDAEISFAMDCEKVLKAGGTGEDMVRPPETLARRPESARAVVQTPSLQMTSSENVDTYKIGDPTVPPSQFPFPNIPEGEIWVPDLKWQNQTTIVNENFDYEAEADRAPLPLPFDDMIAAGRGAEVVEIFEREARNYPGGKMELDIAQIYEVGKGGVPQDKALLLHWMKKLAEKAPNRFHWVGNVYRYGYDGTTKDLKMAAHYYSKGLSRGCGVCGKTLMDLHNDNAAKQELGFDDTTYGKYTIFTYDVGHPDVGYSLQKLVERKYGGFDMTDIRKRAEDISASVADFTNIRLNGSLAIAMAERYRTGLVNEWLINNKQLTDKGELILAANGYSNSKAFGRYYGAGVVEFLDRFENATATQKEKVTSPYIYYLAREAVKGGQLSQSPLAAYSYAAGGTVGQGYDNNFKGVKTPFSPTLIENIMDPAIKAGLATQNDLDGILYMGTEKDLEKCWGRVEYRGWTGAYSQAKMDAVGASYLSGARKAGCFDLVADYEAISGKRYAYPSHVSSKIKRSDELSAISRAAYEKRVAKEASRRASFRSGSSTPRSYISSQSGSAPSSTISSSQAYSQSKARVCSYSTSKTSFCR